MKLRKNETPQEFGNRYETEVQNVLMDIQRECRAYCIPLYDTRSARGSFIPEQPGDFIFLFQGVAWLVEVKTSCVKDTISRDSLSAGQAAAQKLWQRADGKGVVIFHHGCPEGCEFVELWDGVHIRDTMMVPRAKFDRAYCQVTLEKELKQSLVKLFERGGV